MWNVRGVGAGRVGRSSRRASCSQEDCTEVSIMVVFKGGEGVLRLDTFIIIFCEREFLSRGISETPSEM